MDEFIDYVDTDTICKICHAEFLDLDDLEIHKSQVHSSKASKVPCQFCSVSHCDVEQYALHIRNNHIKQFHICELCTRIFVDADEHRKHLNKHHQHPNKCSYTCSQCTFNSKSVKLLENHEFTQHKDVKEGVFITECMPHLSSVLNINALKFIQLLKRHMAFTCMKCQSSYRNADDYIDHLKINKCRSYVCNNCFFVYKRKDSVKKHLELHKECSVNGNEQVLKQCSKCLDKVPAYTLTEHRKKCVIIKCTQCQVRFRSVEELSKHQTKEHATAVLLQICKYCKKEFVGKKNLQNHFNRTHKNTLHLYKYVCVYCDAIFKHPKSLFAHFFTRHKDLEPYTCKICDKTFRIRKKFTIHIKLEHNSIGYVEFDKNYHVFFTDKKSEEPFKPNGRKITDTDADASDIALEESDIQTEEVDLTEESSEHVKQKRNNRIKKLTLEDDNNGKHSGSKHNDNSDFMDITETEGNQTEPEIKEPNQLKRKLRPRNARKKTRKNDSDYEVSPSSSDDEPLLVVKKKLKVKTKNSSYNKISTKKLLRDTVNRFKCNYCKKQCHTFHDFHHHLNSNHKNEMTKCIKCDVIFATKKQLSDHIAQEHSSSRLTEVLKALIEKRKNEPKNSNEIPNMEKFRRTIKKVECKMSDVPAKITQCDNGNPTKLSVQKFIESFTPESNETDKNKVVVESNISIKTVRNVYRPPLIKLHKFEMERNVQNSFKTKLAMPVQFKPDFREEPVVKVSIVQDAIPKPNTIVDESVREEAFYDDIPDHNYEEVTEDVEDYKTDDLQDYRIPDVAEEVMLEGSEEIVKPQKQHKIVIPNVPKELSKMRIAHLVPVAPYYKIVKVEDVIDKTHIKKQEEPDPKNPKVIKLPDGTKLVNVNPLAHLLADKEKVLENYKPSKYYPRKTHDFEQAVAKALMKVETAKYKRTARKKKAE